MGLLEIRAGERLGEEKKGGHPRHQRGEDSQGGEKKKTNALKTKTIVGTQFYSWSGATGQGKKLGSDGQRKKNDKTFSKSRGVDQFGAGGTKQMVKVFGKETRESKENVSVQSTAERRGSSKSTRSAIQRIAC